MLAMSRVHCSRVGECNIGLQCRLFMVGRGVMHG